MELKERLSYYRKRQGLSQIELAEALEVSRQTVSKWETGTALPSAENLLALSRLYRVSVDALLKGTEADGAAAEDAPELTPVSVGLSSTPLSAPERPRALRWRLLLEILAVTVLCDVLPFLADVSLYSGSRAFNLFGSLLRISVCCAVGLCFAWRDRAWPACKRTARLIAVAALLLGLYVLLMPVPLLWRLYDFILGPSGPWDALLPNPVRLFIAWTLCDQCAFFAHSCLIAAFQLGRLRFGRRMVFSLHPQTAA